jgi:hypothetical protein
MVTPVSGKVMGTHDSPGAAQDADLVRSFENLLEDEEMEEVFREFIVPDRRRRTRFPWFLPSRSTLDYELDLQRSLLARARSDKALELLSVGDKEQ